VPLAPSDLNDDQARAVAARAAAEMAAADPGQHRRPRRLAGHDEAGQMICEVAMELPQHPRVDPPTLKRLLARKLPGLPSVGVEATVMEALKVMVEQETGAVLVLDGARVAGLFSDRDFIRHGASGGGPARLTPIREAMADCTAFVTSTHTVPQCLALMTEQRLRHLPVLELIITHIFLMTVFG